MSFENYLQKAWSEHASDAEQVSRGFGEGLSMLSTMQQIAPMAGLVTHVMGEHLAKWEEGVQWLSKLQEHDQMQVGSEADQAVRRSQAALSLGGGLSDTVDQFHSSDQVRILAVTASALAARDSGRAELYFRRALKLVETALGEKDPGVKALAVTGHNLACALEEKSTLSKSERGLMILAAETSRKLWAKVGTWLEVSRAEYRLAMTFLRAGETLIALQHAKLCRVLCVENKAGPLDLFFAFEAVALAERANGQSFEFREALNLAEIHFAMLAADDKAWCASSLEKMRQP